MASDAAPRLDWNNRAHVLRALSQAQANGDYEAYQEFQLRLDSLPPPQRDWNNADQVRQAYVEARIRGDQEGQQELGARLQELDQRDLNPVAGMGELDGQLASAGSTFDNSWRGLRQLAALATEYNPTIMATDAIFDTGIGDQAQAYRGELEREQDERDAINDPLNSEYRSGQVLGYASQVLGPGLGLKGATAVAARVAPSAARASLPGAQAIAQLGRGGQVATRAFLPSTLTGAAAQGGVLGGIQATGTDDSRTGNVATGAALGFGGQLAAPLIGSAIRGGRALIDPFLQSGRERIVGGLLQRFATDPGRIAAPQADAILGQAPTLAEATLDPGIAQLQRSAVSASPEVASAVANARLAANQTRTGLLEQFAGTEADRTAALAGIRQAEDAAYGAIRPLDGVDVAPVVAQIEQVLATGAGRRREVAQPLAQVLDDLRARNGEGLETSVDQLIGVRQNINDLIDGTPLTGASKAQAELIAVRDALDAQIRQVAPRLDEALDARRLGMRPVEQMNLIQQLLQQGAGDVPLPDGGGIARLLNPGTFVRATDDFGARSRFDAAARTATGFRRAEADSVLDDQAMAAVTGVRDGLLRQIQADSLARVPGSPTAQLMAGQNLMDAVANPMGLREGSIIRGALAPVVEGLLGRGYKALNIEDRLQPVLAEALTNPQRAAELLARLPPRDRVLVEQALAPYLSSSTVTAARIGANE